MTNTPDTTDREHNAYYFGYWDAFNGRGYAPPAQSPTTVANAYYDGYAAGGYAAEQDDVRRNEQ